MTKNKGVTIWLTGLPSAGKTTLARELEKALVNLGICPQVLDGDVIRQGLSRGLGYSREDREENLRRIAFMADLLTRNGIVTIAATISPYRTSREAARRAIEHFIEVYVKCPLELCVQRDRKGLYRKAMTGAIQNFTGVSDPYEEPENPELIVESDRESVEQAVARLLAYLSQNGFIRGDDTGQGPAQSAGDSPRKTRIQWSRPFISSEEEAEVAACIRSGWIAMGRRVEELEALVGGLVKSPHAIAVNSGTAALDVALKVLGIQPGDEVIIPAFGYIATANAVLYQHATPVFADVDPETYTIDPDDVERKVTSRTRCIIAIDYAGQGPDYGRLRALAKTHNLALVEDGAPGLGGVQNDRPLCSWGDIGTTSFHAAKTFTTAEGGMLFTGNEEWAKRARMIRSQGEDPGMKYHHPVLGHNYRLTDVHAAIGLAQFRRFHDVLARRAAAAERYRHELAGLPGVILPKIRGNARHAWFLFPMLVAQRDAIRKRLAEDGIETNVSWPLPLYRQRPYQGFAAANCPVAEGLCRQVLCLPLFHRMSEDDQARVVSGVRRAIQQ